MMGGFPRCDGFNPNLLLASSPPASACLALFNCPLAFNINYFSMGVQVCVPSPFIHPAGLCCAAGAAPYLVTARVQSRVPKTCFLWALLSFI